MKEDVVKDLKIENLSFKHSFEEEKESSNKAAL
jgi:hypothetical protein